MGRAACRSPGGTTDMTMVAMQGGALDPKGNNPKWITAPAKDLETGVLIIMPPRKIITYAGHDLFSYFYHSIMPQK